MLEILNPDLRAIVLPCCPWGLATELVLVIDPEDQDAGLGLLWALWRWPGGELRDAGIGRA